MEASKHTYKKLINALIVLALFFFPIGLTQASTVDRTPNPFGGTVIVPPGDPIEIAIANPTGIPAAADLPLAVQLALSDFGMIKGFAVQANDFDTGCDSTTAATEAANIVANAQHVGVLGPMCSSSVIGAAPVFETALLVMITSTATALDLHTHGPNVFNRIVPDDLEVESWDKLVSGMASVQSWEADFQTTYGHAPWNFAKYAYDATMLLLTRIQQVSSVDGGGNLVVDREALATAVRTTSNYSGLTGQIALDVHGTRLNNFGVAVWTDGFDENVGSAVLASPSLDPRWSWINEDATHWSLTARPGFMRIITQPAVPPSNLLLMDIPLGDIELRTRVSFSPTENIQRAGLMIYNSDGNLLVLYHAYCDFSPPDCPGEGIFFDHVDQGGLVGSSFATTTPLAEDMYLRIVQSGGDFSAYVSTDGREWTFIGTHTPAWEPVKVGLTADISCCSAAEIPADFDFFVAQYPAYKQYIPVLQKPASP